MIAALASAVTFAGAASPALAGPELLTGTLVRIAPEAGHEGSYALHSGDGLTRLADDQDPRLVGRSVEVRESRSDAPVIEGRVAAARTAPVIPATPATVRTRRVAVLRVVWSGGAGAGSTDPSPQAVVDAQFNGPGSVNELFGLQTGGALKFHGLRGPAIDVFPRSGETVMAPLTLPYPGPGCESDVFIGLMDDVLDALHMQIGAREEDAGAEYDHLMVVFPRISACDWEGLGTVGGSLTWINGSFGSSYGLSVIAHELAHNLGANHGNAGEGCVRRAADSGEFVFNDTTCGVDPYGDRFNLMGIAVDDPPLMATWQRYESGQLHPDRIGTIASAGTFVLNDANAVVPEGHQMLRLERIHDGSELFFEHRGAIASFDDWGDGAPASTGVMVRYVADPAGAGDSSLLDTVPQTATIADAPLQPGQTFRDERLGVTVTNAGIVLGKATLLVTGTPPVAEPPAPPVAQTLPPPSRDPRVLAPPPPVRAATKIALLSPKLRKGRAKLPKNRRLRFAAPGAGSLTITAGRRRLSTKAATATFRLTAAQRRHATVKVVARGGALAGTLRLTLQVREGKVTVRR